MPCEKSPKRFETFQCETCNRESYSLANESRFTCILGDPGADRGGKGKFKRAKENVDEEKHSRLTMLFFVAIFFRPFRLPLASTICPWVSEDVSLVEFFILQDTAMNYNSN